jgi:hypothetical protein
VHDAAVHIHDPDFGDSGQSVERSLDLEIIRQRGMRWAACLPRDRGAGANTRSTV